MFEQLSQGAHWFSRAVIDMVLPPQCVHCHELVSSASVLCPECWQHLSFIDEPLCDRLGIPFAYDPGDGIVSAEALAHPPEWTRARAAVEYGDVARDLVHALKYHDRHEVCSLMARLMVRAGEPLIETADIVIPVPLHPLRAWQRRFNQSALLARAIAGMCEMECDTGVLLRTRATRQQAGLKGHERRRNVNRAFAVNPARLAGVAGRHVLLIDDVRTTGATARACTRTLLQAGCAGVSVLTFSLVNDPAQLHI